MSELEKLQKYIRMYGRQNKLAADLEVTPAAISAVYVGRNPPSPKLLKAIGLERVVKYVPSKAEV